MYAIIFGAVVVADVLLWFITGPVYAAYGGGQIFGWLLGAQLGLTAILIGWIAVMGFRWHRRFHARVIEEAIRMRGVR